MRVTNNMITYNFLTSLNKSLERQNKIQEQLTDGKQLHRPSDNPVKSIRALRANVSLVENEQYTQNLNDAISWMESTDSAMSNLSSIAIKFKELALSADGTKPPEAYKAIAAEMDGLINQAVTIGNTKLGDRYIFSGQQDKTLPFVRTDDTVTYYGDNNKISMQIKAGVTTPTQDSVNLTGAAIFGANNEMLQHMIEIKSQLETGTPDLNVVLNTGLTNLDVDSSKLLEAQTQLGARMSSYLLAENMLEKANVVITGDVAANEDLDIPKAIIDFKTSETVYKNALSVGAKIMPASLVDFLK
ncbi:flagellar hook-associated protein FlgL [Sporomusa malonica]|uniref:Flagellar hook-associated protein 3 FlgL n=1 Tax=Sporomusa malonica TaxID=112901 RepID=A0A1W1YUL0_9FIRM|nr:flagellar hook-associated protein FlgL [Sporomusa malonica]SMC39834.1 flagellar hook-associated protein 3 FlgL [Sporomusa malonica]